LLTGEGKVSDAVVVKSSGSARLDDAAIKALKGNWRYDPPGDGPMPASVQTEVVFNLEQFP
jgi:TonB family protein